MPPFPLSIRESEEKRSMGRCIGCDFPVRPGRRLTPSRARSTTLLSMRVLFAVLAFCASFARAQDYDILIRNGRIVDGTGDPAFVGDVAIQGGRIAALGFLPKAQAKRTIDAKGLVVEIGRASCRERV